MELNKKMMLAAAIIAAAAVGGPAAAQPGQCSVTGFGTFDCDVAVDGNGFSYELPDGAVLAFALTEAEVGQAFVAQPGELPRAQGDFTAVPDKPGCWANGDGLELCAMVFEGDAS